MAWFKAKVKEVTKRNRGVSFGQIIDELNTVQTTSGWQIAGSLGGNWTAGYAAGSAATG